MQSLIHFLKHLLCPACNNVQHEIGRRQPDLNKGSKTFLIETSVFDLIFDQTLPEASGGRSDHPKIGNDHALEGVAKSYGHFILKFY